MNLPDFSYEQEIYKKGFRVIAGVDEVGRGSFAGPVVAGCVVFDVERVTRGGEPQGRGPVLVSRWKGLGAAKWQDPRVNDSKKMTPRQREVADRWIRENVLALGIGVTSVSQINRHGIKKATDIAFRKAIKNCAVRIEYLLIDAFYIPHVLGIPKQNQKPIIKGDALSFSIAAASIIAKVYRDNLMNRYSNILRYNRYLWSKNKGYGTSEHRKMILKYGTTQLHRKQFVETFLTKH